MLYFQAMPTMVNILWRFEAKIIFPCLFSGYAYYGEYPLAFAASFGHEEIYDYLINHGADPNLQDTFGNTVLHVLVINNNLVSTYLFMSFLFL